MNRSKLFITMVATAGLAVSAMSAYADADFYADSDSYTPATHSYNPTNNENLHQGFYLSGNLGSAFGAVVDDDGSTSAGFDGIGGSGYLGYMFNPYLGLEAGANGFAIPFSSVLIYGATVVGNLPIGSRFSVFAKAGGGAARFHLDSIDLGFLTIPASSVTQGAVLVGTGVGFALTKHLSATAQYNGAIVKNDASDGIVGLLSLGLEWHFSN